MRWTPRDEALSVMCSEAMAEGAQVCPIVILARDGQIGWKAYHRHRAHKLEAIYAALTESAARKAQEAAEDMQRWRERKASESTAQTRQD